MYMLYGKSYTSIVIKPMGSFSEIIDMVNKISYKLYEKMMMKVMNIMSGMTLSATTMKKI